MREVGKDGRVWRLSKESWDTLRPFDTDPNEGIRKMQARIAELEKKLAESPNTINNVTSVKACSFDEKKMQKIIKDTMEEVIAPFTG